MLPPRPQILAVVQARMRSSRLPGKVLMDLLGKPVIEHIIQRVKSSRLVQQVVVATSESSADDVLVDRLENSIGCLVFRDSEEDVLGRFYRCAERYGAEIIVRITADDPLKDPDIIDHAVSILTNDHTLAYCSNTLRPTYPEGLDVEVFRFDALKRAHREATLLSDREHVTPYIWRHPELFKTVNFEHPEDLSEWRWTLDRPEDFQFILAVYRHFYKGHSYFPYREVIDYVRAHPELLRINSGVARNEGYLASLEREQPSGSRNEDGH